MIRHQHGRRVAAVLLAAVLIGMPSIGTKPAAAAAATCDPHDLLCRITPLPETVLNYTACAQAAAGMVLEGYGTIPGSDAKAKLTAVLDYVQQGSYAAGGVFQAHAGFTVADQLPHLVQAAKAFGIPITGATWKRTTAANWVADLRQELETLRRPTIVLLPDLNPIWTTMKHVGHYIVVSGIAADGRIIEHDAWDGQVHVVDQATFRDAWGGGTVVGTTYASPYQYLDVTASGPLVSAPGSSASPTPTPTLAPRSAAKPGGMWIEPADRSQQFGRIHVGAHAYPSKAGEPAIDHVNFTVWWSSLGSKSGAWKLGCRSGSPTSGDTYECDIDPSVLGAPDGGQLWLSFDVYDNVGGSNLSPNGERSATWFRQAREPVGGGWQNYQGDGYVVDYPGTPTTKSVSSSDTYGLYSASASYYAVGPESDPQVEYLVEHFTYATSLTASGYDYTALLDAVLPASYTDGVSTITHKDVTIDGHTGLLLTESGNNVSGDFEMLVIGADLYMIMAAHKSTDTTLDTQSFFDSFHLT